MIARALLGAFLALMVLLPPATLPVAAASGETRTLFLHHTHTGKTGSFTFKVNGQYDQNVLRQMNLFLADWRTHEPTKMDPALFDLLWTIYREVGATQPINIVSSYRTPATNKMLRSKSKAVAENSQHMRGKAMDVFIPGVPLAKLRATAMRHNVGGVGYYPTSGSPFVHVDTGTVRAWPRMTRAQLEKVFPDGKTLHLPVDGKPLSAAGRRYAEAEWNKCHMVPCNGSPSVPSFAPDVPTGAPDVMVASTGAPVPATPSPGMLTALLGSGEPEAPVSTEPTQRMVATIAVDAPIPVARRGTEPQPTQVATADGFAPIPAIKSASMRVATGPSIGQSDGETAVVALANLGGAPQPRVLLTPRGSEPADDQPTMVTAYVPAMPQDPGAQRALQMIIERETTASLPAVTPAPKAPAPTVQVASLGQQPSGGLDVIANLFKDTWSAVTGMGQPPLQAALDARVSPAPNASIYAMKVDLVAPDVDHVAETMVQPVAMSDTFFGEMYEPEGYLDKTTQLGPLATRIGFDPDPTIDAYNSFVIGAPQLVASR